jgi:hypothetical protein
VRYGVVLDDDLPPLPADVALERLGITCLRLSWCDESLQLVFATLAGTWFRFEDAVALVDRIPAGARGGGRAARRRGDA